MREGRPQLSTEQQPWEPGRQPHSVIPWGNREQPGADPSPSAQLTLSTPHKGA